LDLGWWLFGLRFHTEGIGVALPPGYPSRLEAIERYEALTGHPVRHIDYYEGFAALRLSIASNRAGRMMIEAGLLPPDSSMPTNNPASHLLARMLDLPAPTGTTVSYIGNR
jgi:aminoglycoside phosphotransferase (APT) family kinase protein